MTTGQQSGFLGHLRGIFLARECENLSDGHLLERFLVHREEAAFTALVRRHGPMVLGVCQRVLRDRCDAEDAFQGTFLVLARKAASLGRPEQVGNWLYGVAYRTALKARMRRARRQAREEPWPDPAPPEPVAELVWNEIRPVLDEELRRLPAKYRAPLVLCYLEGKTKRQAAECLGRPEGTVSTQLARGRDLLRRRLVRRGLVLSAGVLSAALSSGTASAAVPATLIESTAPAARAMAAGEAATGLVSAQVAALVEGVLRAMLLSKIKSMATMVLGIAVVIAACAAGLLAQLQAADDRDEQKVTTTSSTQKENPQDSDPQEKPKEKDARKEKAKDKSDSAKHKATEERVQWIPYVEKTSLEVSTDNGAVHVTTHVALLARNNVEGKLTAKITAAGATEEEAKSRLSKVKITVTRRDKDKALVISAGFPDEKRGNDGCAFEVAMPGTQGVAVHTGNGPVTLEKVKGPIDVHTGNGAVAIADTTGPVKVHSGNGPLHAAHLQGEADLATGNGAVVYEADTKAAGFQLKTGNGAVTVRLMAGGDGTINASTGHGTVTVSGNTSDQTISGTKSAKKIQLSPKGPESTVHSGNGAITIELKK